jgi:hypothetical protein
MLLMQAVVVFTLVTVTAVSAVVMAVAVTLWLRDVIRSRDGHTDERLGEPSPLDVRAVPLMVLAAVVLAGVQSLRGVPVSFRDTAFAALFMGFALSAAWYLLARRSPELPHGGRALGISAVVAAGFGALWGLAA